MRLLLDTHVLLWLALEPERLDGDVRGAIHDPATEVSASIVSMWEMAIKVRLGRLDVNLAELMQIFDPASKVKLLGVLPEHLTMLLRVQVVREHRDPFDLLLIAQALSERMTLVSRDRFMRAYDVPLMRA